MPELFVPPLPPRDPNWLPSWRAMFGERMRSVVHGLPEPAFQVWHASGRLLNIRFHIVNRPATIGKVLLERHANYLRPELTRKLLKPSLGNGLLTAEGEDWRTQRKLVAPTFSPAAVAQLAPLMAEEAERRAGAFPAEKAPVDLAAVATETTMAIISRALFSGDPRLLSEEAGGHITRLVNRASCACSATKRSTSARAWRRCVLRAAGCAGRWARSSTSADRMVARTTSSAG